MKHQIPWNKTILEDFIEEGLLTDEEAHLMTLRTRNKSTVYQATALNVSTATVDRMVVELKKKYDQLHEQFPDRFPKRHRSQKERFSVSEDDRESTFPRRCLNCNYLDTENMTALELVECQLNCKCE